MTFSNFKVKFTMSVVFVLMLFGFTNCAEYKSQNPSSSTAASGSTAVCDQALIEAFSASYRPILTDSQLCARCHTETGVSPIKFASANLQTGYSHFMNVGVEMVDANAISTTHAPGVTGPANQTRISSARATWNTAYAAYQDCKSQTIANRATAISTNRKNSVDLYFDDARAIIFTWNLNSGEASPDNQRFPGMLSITVRVKYEQINNQSVATGYVLTKPRLKMLTGEQEVEVEGVSVQINGVDAEGIEPFLSARKVIKGIDYADIYNGEVFVKRDKISNSDTFSLGLEYFDLRNRTDNPPVPATPTLTIANGGFARQTPVTFAITNDSTARLWCVTTSSKVLKSAAETCPGFESAMTNGWVSARPTTSDLATLGRPIADGETVSIYVWIANSDLKINAAAATANLTFDSTAPAAPTFASFGAINTQAVDIVGLSDSNESVTWCVKDNAVLANLQNSNGCVFTSSKPTFVVLTGGGTRYVVVYARDRAGNTTASTSKTIVNPFGRISFAQLTGTDSRAIFRNRCFSCHGPGGANVSSTPGWDATSYADSVNKKSQILSRIANSSKPSDFLSDLKERALIEVWFSQTTTPVETP